MKTKQTLIAALVAVASATSAQAQCLTDAQAADLVANYVAKTPAANPENLTDADGACTRGKVNALLAQRMGKHLVAGHTVSLPGTRPKKKAGVSTGLVHILMSSPIWRLTYRPA